MDKINIELEISKEVEHQVLDNHLELNAALRQAKEMYKEKTHNSTDQSMRNEHEQLFNDIIPPGTDLDNNEIYDIKTGQTVGELK